jgi:hypothetical protein
MERFQKTIKLFKKECPLAFPITVRRVALTGLDGYCEKKGRKFYIAIDKDLDENRAIDTLIHEWAHGRAWNHLLDVADKEEFERRVHDASWGVAYAEVYRIYECSL